MFSGRITQAAIRAFDFLALALPDKDVAKHLKTGQRGEEDAYFYLRRRGYVMVARNFRSPRRHGEIDLIAWHKDVLCFIEVKTRTTHDVKPAETAVDRHKWRQLYGVSQEYLRGLHCVPKPFGPQSSGSQSSELDPQWRFDVITVYYDRHSSRPRFELFQNALPSS